MEYRFFRLDQSMWSACYGFHALSPQKAIKGSFYLSRSKIWTIPVVCIFATPMELYFEGNPSFINSQPYGWRIVSPQTTTPIHSDSIESFGTMSGLTMSRYKPSIRQFPPSSPVSDFREYSTNSTAVRGWFKNPAQGRWELGSVMAMRKSGVVCRLVGS